MTAFRIVTQEKDLLETYGKNYRGLVSVRRQIQETREYIERREQRLVANAQQVTTETYLDYLRQELARIATSRELLKVLYDEEYAAAKELVEFEVQQAEYQRNITRTQQLYDGIVGQLQQANLIQDYGGFKADVISPPRFGKKVAPSVIRILMIALLAGAALGVGLAYVADISYTAFRSPEEVRTGLELPVLGLIRQAKNSTNRKKQATTDVQLDGALCTYHRPMSPETEAYRALRTGLYFSSRGKSSRVVQVTSPTPGDGKSTVASNLSVCIAQSGKRVLLIDGDMRRPTQDRIFGVDTKRGLSTVIALEDEPSDAILETPIDNLFFLPAGQLPPDPAELLTSSRFAELIDAMRDEYDFVVLDSGPLIAVSDPSVIMTQVDGLVMTVRLSKTPRKQAERAKEILTQLDAPILGVVVNAVGGSEAKGYGYGYYTYYHHSATGKNGRNGKASIETFSRPSTIANGKSSADT